jgi:hypothetical protein
VLLHYDAGGGAHAHFETWSVAEWDAVKEDAYTAYKYAPCTPGTCIDLPDRSISIFTVATGDTAAIVTFENAVVIINGYTEDTIRGMGGPFTTHDGVLEMAKALRPYKPADWQESLQDLPGRRSAPATRSRSPSCIFSYRPTCTSPITRMRAAILARFLWTMPQALPPRWSEARVSHDAHRQLNNLFQTLRQLRTDEPIRFSPKARTRWAAWYKEEALGPASSRIDPAVVSGRNGDRKPAGSTGLSAALSDNMPTQVARIALVLHATHNPDNLDIPLSAKTLDAAINIAAFHQHEADRIFSQIAHEASPGAVLGNRITHAITAASGQVTKTTLHQKLGGHVPATALNDALAALIDSGLITASLARTENGSGPRGNRFSLSQPVNERIKRNNSRRDRTSITNRPVATPAPRATTSPNVTRPGTPSSKRSTPSPYCGRTK